MFLFCMVLRSFGQVKDGNLLSDFTSGATNLAGKVGVNVLSQSSVITFDKVPPNRAGGCETVNCLIWVLWSTFSQ